MHNHVQPRAGGRLDQAEAVVDALPGEPGLKVIAGVAELVLRDIGRCTLRTPSTRKPRLDGPGRGPCIHRLDDVAQGVDGSPVELTEVAEFQEEVEVRVGIPQKSGGFERSSTIFANSRMMSAGV